MDGRISWVVTCEHASNALPAEYAPMVEKSCLNSHKGFDIGAKEYAIQLAQALSGRLFLGKYSRLLIDINRSENNSRLFSEYMKTLPSSIKESILKRYYRPFRKSVFDYITQEIARNHIVIHLSCHTFTPCLHGHVRKMDVGILYDPHRLHEKALAQQWKRDLQKNTSMAVQLNAPYRGMSDGHTASLRLCFSQQQYIGIEIEVNQRLFAKEASSLWKNVWFPSLILKLRARNKITSLICVSEAV